MQLIVLGMHRSGTSVVSRLLGLMGAYVGESGDVMAADQNNERGYWERTDVVGIDEAILRDNQADWFLMPDTEPSAWRLSDGSSREMQAVVAKLDAHSPWVVKDPRMCLLFRFWKPKLSQPFCVFVYRSPLQVARSLQARDDLPLHYGVALWELYMVEALKATAGLPRVLIAYDAIVRDPLLAATQLCAELKRLGVIGLREPDPEQVRAYVSSSLRHHSSEATQQLDFVNHKQQSLIRACESGQIPESGSWEISGGTRSVLSSFQRSWRESESLRGQLHAQAEQNRLQVEELHRQFVRQRDAELSGLQAQYAVQLKLETDALLARIDQIHAEAQASREQELASLKQQYDQQRLDELSQLEQQYQQRRLEELAALKRQRHESQEMIGKSQARVAALEESLELVRVHTAITTAGMSRLEAICEEIRASVRWRLGNALVRAAKFEFGHDPGAIFAEVVSIIGQYRGSLAKMEGKGL